MLDHFNRPFMLLFCCLERQKYVLSDYLFLTCASSARSQYRLYLENERKKRESVCESLQNDADKSAKQAEGKAGSKMAKLITKSNTLHRRHKEKKGELFQLEERIEEKSSQLRLLWLCLSPLLISQFLSLLLLFSPFLSISCFPYLFSFLYMYVCLSSSTTVTPFLCHLNSNSSLFSPPPPLPISHKLSADVMCTNVL